MRVVLQRVSEARVTVAGERVGEIGTGLLILLGIERGDEGEDVDWLVRKDCGIRIFGDDEGLMNLSVKDIEGEALVVSQFTLHARTKKGTRPSFERAARPEEAIPHYERFAMEMGAVLGESRVETGRFGAMMDVALVNDGPVTITLDSKVRE